MEVVDGLSGEVRSPQIFVAVLGASNYTYAEASLSQSLPDWIASHVRAFAYFGGAARQTVSDNLKAGITRACFHEPMVNRTYADPARHDRTTIVPARPYRPRDSGAPAQPPLLLAALNEAIHALLIELNDRPLRSWGRSRRDLFEELDRRALTALPDEPYEYAEWQRCRVSLDYHVEIAKHYYSVPNNLVHQEVEAPIIQKTIEIFLRGKRVASHLRSTLPHRPTTISEHAELASPLRDWTMSALFRSRQGRSRCRDIDRRHLAVAAASGTALPLRHRHSRAGQALWPRARRRRLRPCSSAQRLCVAAVLFSHASAAQRNRPA
jgi:transposase